MSKSVSKEKPACVSSSFLPVFFAIDQDLVFLFAIFFFLEVPVHVIINSAKWYDHPVGSAIELVSKLVDGLLYQVCPDQNIVFVRELCAVTHLFEISPHKETANIMLPLLGPLFEEFKILLAIVLVQQDFSESCIVE